MRKNQRRANHTIIAHSVDSTFIHQDVQETAPEPFSALVSGVLMLGRLRLDWLLLSVAPCGEKIYCGWYLYCPSLRQRVLSCHYNIAASSHCPYSHWNLHSVCTGSTSHALHGTWRLEGFDTGFQTGFIISAMI